MTVQELWASDIFLSTRNERRQGCLSREGRYPSTGEDRLVARARGWFRALSLGPGGLAGFCPGRAG
jgi:hypothetical protein